MPDKPPPVAEGDRLSAARTNLVSDAAFRDVMGNAPGFSGPDGFAFRNEQTMPAPYAKAQSDWEENDGDPKVSVKMCDADGTTERGPAFDVYLPRRRSTDDPNVIEDDVIRWEWDYEGRRVPASHLATGVIFGKLDGALSQGGSATLSIWTGTTLADSGDNETVYDWFLEANAELASGTKCGCTFYNGKWYVTTAECPTA